MMMLQKLTVRPMRVYAHLAAFNSAAGRRGPSLVGGHRRESGFFVSRHGCALYGRAVWETVRSAGANYRSANPHGSAHPSSRRGAEIQSASWRLCHV